MFARHGIPTTIKSDNGPHFNSEEYKRYLEILGIKAKYLTSKWPQGNTEAERFMQPLGKASKTGTVENRPWQLELSIFLLQYRTAPRSSTQVPPAELMFNRTIKGKLPVLKDACDYVLVRQDQHNKISPNFNLVPYVVTNRSYSKVAAQNKNGLIITRNVSQFKQKPPPKTVDNETNDDEEQPQPAQQQEP